MVRPCQQSPQAHHVQLQAICHLAGLQCYIQQLQELRRIEQELPPQPPPPAVSPATRAGPNLMRLRSIEQPGSPLALIRTGVERCFQVTDTLHPECGS
jgi:hypothetical protein